MFADDLSVYFADFGADATLAGQPVRGLFDSGHALNAVGPMGMAAASPSLTLATATVPAYPVGLAVTVAGTGYLVAAHEPDGTGISRLWLEVSA